MGHRAAWGAGQRGLSQPGHCAWPSPLRLALREELGTGNLVERSFWVAAEQAYLKKKWHIIKINNNNPPSIFLHTSPKIEKILVVHLKQLRNGYQLCLWWRRAGAAGSPSQSPPGSAAGCWVCHRLPSTCGLKAQSLRELTARHRVQGSLGTSMPSQACGLGCSLPCFLCSEWLVSREFSFNSCETNWP